MIEPGCFDVKMLAGRDTVSNRCDCFVVKWNFVSDPFSPQEAPNIIKRTGLRRITCFALGIGDGFADEALPGRLIIDRIGNPVVAILVGSAAPCGRQPTLSRIADHAPSTVLWDGFHHRLVNLNLKTSQS